jgi:hypothetical protein
MSYHTVATVDPTARPLTEEQLRAAIPSLFAVEAHESRSERFRPIPTIDIVQGLQREGWLVTKAQQQRTADVGRRGFTKHLIRLRHRDSTARTLNGTYPEIVIQNGNDGSSSYQIMGGLFRLVCLNGMVIGEGHVERVRVAHRGDVMDRVIEGSFKVLDETTRMTQVIEPWRQLELSRDEQHAFARAAHTIRFGEEQDDGRVVANTPIQPEQLLQARRWDDRGDDLWLTFNRVQENALRGGLTAYGRDANGRARRTTSREVRGIQQDVKLNSALFQLASEMAALKA